MPLGGEAMPEPGDCDCQLHKDIVHWRDNYYWQGALTTGGLIEIDRVHGYAIHTHF